LISGLPTWLQTEKGACDHSEGLSALLDSLATRGLFGIEQRKLVSPVVGPPTCVVRASMKEKSSPS
jgi:hypothetical protein